MALIHSHDKVQNLERGWSSSPAILHLDLGSYLRQGSILLRLKLNGLQFLYYFQKRRGT